MSRLENGGYSNRSVVRPTPIIHISGSSALPWPRIGSLYEASPCRVSLTYSLLTIALTGAQEMVKEFFLPGRSSRITSLLVDQVELGNRYPTLRTKEMRLRHDDIAPHRRAMPACVAPFD